MSDNTNSGVARLKSRLDFLCYTLACREKMSSQAERTLSRSHHADTARQFPHHHFPVLALIIPKEKSSKGREL
ncbi:hypothetical protein CGU00_14735 [Vibrio metoecus]|nr:hypothetical protein CGU00_14735 [Vibrio metoecus]PAR60204.1 hypothetical protein CGT90_17215 [Vibrio metoecus]